MERSTFGLGRSPSANWVAMSTGITFATIVLVMLALPAGAERRNASRFRVCSETASVQDSSCRFAVRADLLEAFARCLNVGDAGDRAECYQEAHSEKRESQTLCGAQRRARIQMCREIGETAYEPDMSAELFQDPRNPKVTNSHYPLEVGNRWVFSDGEERIEIVVLDETKRVGEIDCLVVNDRVSVDGRLVEDTDDWFGLRTDGTVEYCGEAVQDFEFYEGDDPEEAQLISIEGSFKAGEAGAKSGTVFLASPVVGTSYRQEWDAGNAEDNGRVLSVDYAYGNDAELDEEVPEALARLMCGSGDCVVIRDTASLDPGAFERKYYAPGIGKFLETKPTEGTAVPLVNCNFDDRCAQLPSGN